MLEELFGHPFEPEAIALSDAHESISYQELQGRLKVGCKNLVDNFDIDAGPVPLIADNSVDISIVILATQYLGCGYLPIDPSLPTAKLEEIISRNSISKIFIRPGLTLLEDESANFKKMGVELLIASTANTDSAAQFEIEPSGSLAYMLYTSGTTGNPKAIVMKKESVKPLIDWQQKNYGQEPLTTLQLAALTFDVSYQEIMATLNEGGHVVIGGKGLLGRTDELLDVLIKYQVQRFYLPANVLHLLAETMLSSNKIPTALRHVICGGDVLKLTPAIKEVFGKLDNCQMSNHYGPTEAHAVSSFEMYGDVNQWPQFPPIGKPFDFVNTYIVDEQSNCIDPGEIGELLIGGPSLAEGYWGDEELTRSKFVDNSSLGERVYLTGDLVKIDESGVLHYFGRKDQQEKINGYRVDLSELEMALNSHANIKESAVTSFERMQVGKVLVAYIVEKTASQRSKSNAVNFHKVYYEYLAKQFETYMVPITYVFCDSLPRNTNGKIDSKKLPEPEPTERSLINKMQQARTTKEQRVCEVWQSLLSLTQVGVDDNFFELGGTSLMVPVLVNHLKARLGIETTVVLFLQNPTISGVLKQPEHVPVRGVAVKGRRKKMVGLRKRSNPKVLQE